MPRRQPRDAQRQKVYRHEWSLRDALPSMKEGVSPEEMAELVVAAFAHYGIPERVCGVHFNERMYARCCFNPTTGGRFGRIEIAAAKRAGTWGHAARVALHEAAHAIINAQGCLFTLPWHGAEFVAVCHELWRVFLGVPDDVLQEHAHRYGVMRSRTFEPERYGAHLFLVESLSRTGTFDAIVRADNAEQAKARYPHASFSVSSYPEIAPF